MRDETEAGAPVFPAALAAGLVLLSMLGQGGGSPDGLFLWHSGLGVALAALLLLPGAIVGGPSRLAPGPLHAFAAFGAILVLGAAFAPYGFAAWLALVEVAAFLGVAFVGARAGSLPDWIVGLLAAGGVAEVLHAGLERLQGVLRPAGTFFNPNHLAAWLVAILLLVADRILAGTRTSRRWRWTAGVAALVLVAGIVLTGSRGALVGLAAGAVALVLGYRRPRTRWPGWRTWSVLAGLAALGLAVVAMRGATWDPFRYHRLWIWTQSLELARESPWTGCGPGQFPLAAGRVQFADGVPPLQYDKHFSSPHSDWIRVPAELGWPGLAALALALALVVGFVSRRRAAGESGPGSAGSVAALVALAAHAGVDDLTHRPALYVLAAVLLGGLLSLPARSRATGTPAQPLLPFRRFAYGSAARLPAAARLALALALAAAFVAGDLVPWHAWREAASAPAGPPGRAVLESAERLDRQSAGLPARIAESWVFEPAPWDLDDYASARSAAERAERLSPEDASIRVTRARVEARGVRQLFRDAAGRERAAETYERAAARAPRDPLILLELARFLLDTDDPAGAARAAERALALEPNSVAPRLVLAEALLAAGGPAATERAAALAGEASELATRWSTRTQDSRYAALLLAADPRALARIQARIGAVFAADRPAAAPGEAGVLP